MTSGNINSVNCLVQQNKLRILIPHSEINNLNDENYTLYESSKFLVTSSNLFKYIQLFSSELYDSETDSYDVKISLRSHKRIPKVITKSFNSSIIRADSYLKTLLHPFF